MAFWHRKKRQDREPRTPLPASDATLILAVDRDSVAAGDDVESHAFRDKASEAETINALVGRLRSRASLPSIAGGRATWVVETYRPLAVLAQQAAAPMWLVDNKQSSLAYLEAARPRLNFRYWCQVEPDAVFPGLRAGGPIPDQFGHAAPPCNCRSHDEFFGENAESISKEKFVNLRDEGWQVLLRCPHCWQNWLLERFDREDNYRPSSLRKLAPCVCDDGVRSLEGKSADDYLARHLVHSEPRFPSGDDLYRCLRTDARWRRRHNPSPGSTTWIGRAPFRACVCREQSTFSGAEAVAYLEGHLIWHSIKPVASERKYRCPYSGLVWLLDFEPFVPWEKSRKNLKRTDEEPFRTWTPKPLWSEAASTAAKRTVSPHAHIAEAMRASFWDGLLGDLKFPEPAPSTVAWVALAAWVAADRKPGKFSLTDLVAAADALDHAIPTWQEAAGGVKALTSRGWMQYAQGDLFLLAAGAEAIAREADAGPDLYVTRRRLAEKLETTVPPRLAFVERLCREMPEVKPLLDWSVEENGEVLDYDVLAKTRVWSTKRFIEQELGMPESRATLARLYAVLDGALATEPLDVQTLVALGFLEDMGGPPVEWWWQRLDLPPGLRAEIERQWPMGTPTLADLSRRQAEAKFPQLGKKVGNFPLWDSYVAGYLSSAMKGTMPPAGAVGPDDETREKLLAICRKPRYWTQEEDELMDYASLLMEAQAALDTRPGVWRK